MLKHPGIPGPECGQALAELHASPSEPASVQSVQNPVVKTQFDPSASQTVAEDEDVG